MKNIYVSLLISFVIHSIILIVLFIIDTDRIPIRPQLEINIQPTISTSQTKSKSPDQIHTDIFPEKTIASHANTKVNLYPFDYHFLLDSLHKSISLSSDTSATLNQKNWDQFLMDKWKKEYLLSEINLPPKNDSQLTAFSMNKLNIFQTDHDDVGGTADGGQPLLILEKIVSFLKQQMDKKYPPQFNFVPSETQLNIISILSSRENATQLEIYSLLSSKPPITNEILNKDLDLLTYKGFLTREKISPQQIFDFFGIPIEMSHKNQLNSVYRYNLNIKEQELISYLQSRLYLLEEKLQTDPPDSSVIISKINTLQQKIFSLIHE
ncbi:hypothetical protein JW824_11845 [bacterium]|nr:hypothetical protein [bacterium]